METDQRCFASLNMTAALSAAHQQNVRRLNFRIELNVILPAAPGVCRTTQ
jgi:hypothetical protein